MRGKRFLSYVQEDGGPPHKESSGEEQEEPPTTAGVERTGAAPAAGDGQRPEKSTRSVFVKF